MSRSVSCRRPALSLLRSRPLPGWAGAVWASSGALGPQLQPLAQSRSKGTLQGVHINSLGSASVLDKQWFALLLAHVRVQWLSAFDLCFSGIIHCHTVNGSDYFKWMLVEHASAFKHHWSCGSGASSDLYIKWDYVCFGLLCFLPEFKLSPMSLF